MQNARRYIKRLSPFNSLLLLAVPFAMAEPLKVAAIYIFGRGHWMFGAVVMLIAYGLSVFLVERLFKIVKPKVLTMSWFAVIWTGFVEIRDNFFGWFRNVIT